MDTQPPTNREPGLHVGVAVLIGHIFVNLPVLLIMGGFTMVGLFLFPNLLLLFFLVGFVFAWLWWSFMVPLWRRWALQQNVPEAKLQKWATYTGLTWPKGSIFEKTEFKLNDEDEH